MTKSTESTKTAKSTESANQAESTALAELRKLHRAMLGRPEDGLGFVEVGDVEQMTAAQIAAEILNAYRTLKAGFTETLLRAGDIAEDNVKLQIHVDKLTALKASIRRAQRPARPAPAEDDEPAPDPLAWYDEIPTSALSDEERAALGR